MNTTGIIQIYTRPSWRYFLVTEGDVGYIVITNNNKLDLGQCMCCCTARKEIGEAVRANRGTLTKVTMCGTHSAHNTELGIDATFDDLNKEEWNQLEAKIMALEVQILAVIKQSDKLASNIAEVRSLLRQLRYEDAKQHCEVCGLNYETFLEEVKAKM
jgi:hypothetical protein